MPKGQSEPARVNRRHNLKCVTGLIGWWELLRQVELDSRWNPESRPIITELAVAQVERAWGFP